MLQHRDTVSIFEDIYSLSFLMHVFFTQTNLDDTIMEFSGLILLHVYFLGHQFSL